MAEERRAYPRCRIRQMMEVTSVREKAISAESVNISEGGILCKSDEPVEPLTTVFLMLSIPGEDGEHLIKGEGMVMHSVQKEGSWFFGVAFNQLSPEDRKAVTEYLANCEPQE